MEVRVFRNLLEAINSLERRKALVSTVNHLFNPSLAFYQEDIFGGLRLDKYKENTDLGYGVLGRYISEFIPELGIEYSEDKDNHAYYDKLGLISSKSIIVRSDDLLEVLGELGERAKDLEVLDKGPIKKLTDFVKSSRKILSGLSSSFGLFLFSSFRGDLNEDEGNLLISGVHKGKDNTVFSDFWEKLLFGSPESYEKLLSVFDEDFKEYVLSSIPPVEAPGSFSLPFGRFSSNTRFLFFEERNLGRGVGLFSIDERLSSEEISERFTNFLTNRRDISLSAVGSLDLYYSKPRPEEGVVLIPVDLDVGGRRVLVFHTFLVADLFEHYFKFYADLRGKSPLYADYIFKLHPYKVGEHKGKIVLDANERIDLKIEGLYGVNLNASFSFNTDSVGEMVEIQGNKGLVPKGPTSSYGSLYVTVYGFSIDLDEKLDLSDLSRGGEEPISIDKFRSGYIFKGDIWKNKKFSDVIRRGIERFESKFLSNFPSSCFLSDDGEEYLDFRDKKFLLEMIKLTFIESLEAIKIRLDKCSEKGEKCGFRLFVDIDEEKYGKNIIRISKVDYTLSSAVSNLINVKVTSEKSINHLKKTFEERTLYSKSINYFDESLAKLCFESGIGGKVEIKVDLPLHEEKLKDLLKRNSYIGFINWSLKGVGELRKDQAELYSVFLDLAPYDPNSVRLLHSEDIYGGIKKIVYDLEEALEHGTFQLYPWLHIGVRIKEKNNKICILPDIGDHFVKSFTAVNSFVYRPGKSTLEIEVVE